MLASEIYHIIQEPRLPFNSENVGLSWTGKELEFLTVQILGQIWTIDWRWSEALSVKSALTLSFKIIAFLIAHCVIRYFATKLAFSHNFIYSPTKGQVPWVRKLTFNSQYIWKWTNANPMKILGQLASHPKLLIGSKLSLG